MTGRAVLLWLWAGGVFVVGIVAGPWWALAWWIAYPTVVLLAALAIVTAHDEWIRRRDAARAREAAHRRAAIKRAFR